MRPGLLLDTGPLVALLDRRDVHHEWTKDLFRETRPPAYTCEAVLSEVCFLLRSLPGGSDAAMRLVEDRVVEAPFRLAEEASAVRRLMSRYASVPMSLADACLVRLSELHGDVPLATFDGDFRVYRRSGRRVVPTVMPDR